MYTFPVKVSEKEYYDFNVFVMCKSAYGKKDMKKSRIYISILFVGLALLSCILEDFSTECYYQAALYLIMLGVTQIILKPMSLAILKAQIKSMKKGGKMPYSAEAVLEFTETGFSETTADHKSEQAYTAVERVSVIEDVAIYVHINKMMAFILPKACVETQELWEELESFLRTKISIVDVYPKKK